MSFTSGFQNLRAVVFVLVIGVGAIYGAGKYLLGSVDVHVIVNEGQQVRLSLDGQALNPASTHGEHLRFDVAQGTHTVTLEDLESGKTRTFSLKVGSGFDDYVLPVSEEQCFTRFDVSKTMYESRSNKGGTRPTISGKYQASGPFEMPGSSYFSVEELPKKLSKNGSAHLLLATPCALHALEDGQLIQLAGFKTP